MGGEAGDGGEYEVQGGGNDARWYHRDQDHDRHTGEEREAVHCHPHYILQGWDS